jgi:hypothetical protein
MDPAARQNDKYLLKFLFRRSAARYNALKEGIDA